MMHWQPYFFTPFNQDQNLPILINFFSVEPTRENFPVTLLPIEQKIQQKSQFFAEQKICLTIDDLQKQGYQSNKTPWTQEEDKKLLYLYERKKLSWEQIAKKIVGRNKKMCYSRYRRLQSGTKNQWTKEDNQKLLKLIEEKGENWKQIANHFKNRNAKQIKEHYKNYARPDIDKSQWSLEDDLILIKLINTYGKNWKLIEQQMPTRSLNQVKNRFFGKLKKLNESLYGQKSEKQTL